MTDRLRYERAARPPERELSPGAAGRTRDFDQLVRDMADMLATGGANLAESMVPPPTPGAEPPIDVPGAMQSVRDLIPGDPQGSINARVSPLAGVQTMAGLLEFVLMNPDMAIPAGAGTSALGRLGSRKAMHALDSKMWRRLVKNPRTRTINDHLQDLPEEVYDSYSRMDLRGRAPQIHRDLLDQQARSSGLEKTWGEVNEAYDATLARMRRSWDAQADMLAAKHSALNTELRDPFASDWQIGDMPMAEKVLHSLVKNVTPQEAALPTTLVGSMIGSAVDDNSRR